MIDDGELPVLRKNSGNPSVKIFDFDSSLYTREPFLCEKNRAYAHLHQPGFHCSF